MSEQTAAEHSSPLEIFLIFLRLGLTSFGGPIAHLGYFRSEFVERRGWFSDHAYADLVSVCQVLPGPASSQAGFGIGLARGGALGGLAAFVGFTLPSALLMTLFAFGVASLQGPLATGALHGLKIVAVAVVAQALWGMARAAAPDLPRMALALVAGLAAFLLGGSAGQAAALGLGAACGLLLMRSHPQLLAQASATAPPPVPIPRATATGLLLLAVGLLFAGPVCRALGLENGAVDLFDAVYRAGALVFGGGHVVLPLLREAVVGPGWVSAQDFVAGYGAAQAMPGPLFSFAAYIGAVKTGDPAGWAGAALATCAIFLPGLLLVSGALPHWQAIRELKTARAVILGINAAVVGILAAAFYDPVWASAIAGPLDALLALAAFLALTKGKAQPWLVVTIAAAAGAIVGRYHAG